MFRRTCSTRLVAWSIVWLLVLKAALPMLAAVAAQMRSVPVGEICSVFGVRLPRAVQQQHVVHAGEQHDRHDHSSPDYSKHAGDHCALTALAALGAPGTHASPIAPAGAPAVRTPGDAHASVHDACAAWAARLRHGPPSMT